MGLIMRLHKIRYTKHLTEKKALNKYNYTSIFGFLTILVRRDSRGCKEEGGRLETRLGLEI